MDKVGIIGAGSWGTALSLVLANNGHSVHSKRRNRYVKRKTRACR